MTRLWTWTTVGTTSLRRPPSRTPRTALPSSGTPAAGGERVRVLDRFPRPHPFPSLRRDGRCKMRTLVDLSPRGPAPRGSWKRNDTGNGRSPTVPPPKAGLGRDLLPLGPKDGHRERRKLRPHSTPSSPDTHPLPTGPTPRLSGLTWESAQDDYLAPPALPPGPTGGRVVRRQGILETARHRSPPPSRRGPNWWWGDLRGDIHVAPVPRKARPV